ncbi:MAG: CBS domain-containing protein [Candidatus Krumholzibacteriia bacterium]
MQVRSLMSRHVVSARPDTSVNDVAKCMAENDISGVPVVDDDGRLVGIITELDMIVRNGRLEVPTFLQIFDASIPLELPGHLQERLRHMLGTQARDVMTTKVCTVNADAEIEELVELMVKRRVNPVPVLDAGKLAGIVSRSDIVRMMATEVGAD